MLIDLKGIDGATVVIQTSNLLYIGPAVDERKTPLLNTCAAVFVNKVVIPLRGTAAEVAEIIRGKLGLVEHPL